MQKIFIVSNKQNVTLWKIREFYGRLGTPSCSFRSLFTAYWWPTSFVCVPSSSMYSSDYDKDRPEMWHLQEKEDIYDSVKGWDVQTFVCMMKDGTMHYFIGSLDEDYEGHISVHISGIDDDYDYVDDIVKWREV